METVSLRQRMTDGRDLKRTCLVFSGNEGLEGLLQMKERFDNICHAFQFDTGEELFSNFEQTLTDNAEACWQNLVADIPDARRSDWSAHSDTSCLRHSTAYCRHSTGSARSSPATVRFPHRTDLPARDSGPLSSAITK